MRRERTSYMNEISKNARWLGRGDAPGSPTNIRQRSRSLKINGGAPLPRARAKSNPSASDTIHGYGASTDMVSEHKLSTSERKRADDGQARMLECWRVKIRPRRRARAGSPAPGSDSTPNIIPINALMRFCKLYSQHNSHCICSKKKRRYTTHA